MTKADAERPLSEVVRLRRATPHFDSTPVPEADLQTMLDAALLAPSGNNLQPWRFVVVRDPEQRKRLQQAAMGQAKVAEAPVVVVACGDPEGWRDNLDEILRMGHERGLGRPEDNAKMRQGLADYFSKFGDAAGLAPHVTVWINRHVMIAFTTLMWMAEVLGYDTAPMEGFYESKVRQVLNIPERVRVVALLAIGRLAGEDKKFAGRLPMNQLVFDNEWGKGLEF